MRHYVGYRTQRQASNTLLEKLPRAEYEELATGLESVKLSFKQKLLEQNKAIAHVDFTKHYSLY